MTPTDPLKWLRERERERRMTEEMGGAQTNIELEYRIKGMWPSGLADLAINREIARIREKYEEDRRREEEWEAKEEERRQREEERNRYHRKPFPEY